MAPPMPSGPTSESVERLRWFHSVERSIFTRLFIGLNYSRVEAMRIVALWLWLDSQGFTCNIISQVAQFDDGALNAAAFEAGNILNYLEGSYQSWCGIPFTKVILNLNTLQREYFDFYRYNALRTMTRNVSEVLTVAFEDIVHGSSSSNPNGATSSNNPTGGSLNIHIGAYATAGASTSRGTMNTSAGVKPPSDSQVPIRERTVAIFFSSFNPLTESEIRDFFELYLGPDCIEKMYFQMRRTPGQRPVAILSFRHLAAMNFIFSDRRSVDIMIGRKFVTIKRLPG